MSQWPDSVLQRPEGVSQRPDILRFWQDVQDISGYPGGVTARLRRALAPCRSSPGGLAQSARGRWLNTKEARHVATGRRAPLKCQHQQRGRGERSADRSARTAPRAVNEFSGYQLLLKLSGVESTSLTLEGQRQVFPSVFNLFFSVSGNCKESAGFALWKAVENRLGSPFLSRFHSDFSRLQRDSADCAAIAEQSQINSDGIAMNSNLHTCRKRGCETGRMCEVGPPASGLSFFTGPYLHLAVLNGNPALRGCFQAEAGG